MSSYDLKINWTKIGISKFRQKQEMFGDGCGQLVERFA